NMYLLGLLVVAMTLVACTNSALHGNGDVVSETRTVSEFDAIDADDGASVFLTIDEGATGDVQLEVVTDSNLMQFLKTSVSGETLRVVPQRRGGVRTSEGFKVSATIAALSGVEVSNGAHATITGTSAEVTLTADAGAWIHGEAFEADSATVDVNNGAHVTVCVSGSVTGEVDNGAELIVACGGNVSGVSTSNGGKVSS
ncbi:MAG: DUF2807 domain-containing protein, partial [Acidimicrobiia bacterium]